MSREMAAAGPVTCPKCGARPESAAGAVNFCPVCGTDLRPAAGGARTGAFVQQVIADRYRLLALLGEGGMGAVYKAEHIRMGKALAVKIVRGDYSRPAGAAERFLSEARIVSRLSHPHTIAVFDFGEIDAEGSGLYLAMEYVPGQDLASVLRELGTLPERRAAEIGQQLLGSLAEAHDAGIVHRDVKPGNVMLMETRSGEDYVKVLDFGIAKLRSGAEPAPGQDAGSASTTSAGSIVGTPNYLAPEQARGEPLDGRSDLYAVGCVLHELVSGRPPFTAPTPMEVVAAHLRETPPRLDALVPGTSGRFADVVAKALAKRPEDRYASADAMREALAEVAEPTGLRALARERGPETTGGLALASREDFEDFERQVRALRRNRILAPAVLAAVLALAGLAVWRWTDVYAALAARAPKAAALLPAALRPSALFDGDEHEPNDVPLQANPLPLPPGPDGRPAGGVATVRGHVGARLSDTSGDVDIFRVEVPAGDGRRRVLVAEWRGERQGEGIRGLDVALALNRARTAADARTSAPLVASVNRGGPGRPETLTAAVEPGTWFLSVREVHDAASGPVEKPTDAYVLEVRLGDPAPGEEVEPNDGPDRSGARYARYLEWRATAARNALGEGAPVHGETAADDPDLFAVGPRAPGEAPEVVLAVPDPGLALAARRWVPDAEDLDPRPVDRERFEDAGAAGPGQPLVVRLGGVPAPNAPVLLRLAASEGQGRYDLLALGPGAVSGAAALALVRALGEAGRGPAALEAAAAYAAELPGAAARDEVLLLAGTLAERLAAGLAPGGVAAYDRAARRAGASLFEVEGGRVRYRGAFEALASGAGRPGRVAALRLAALAAPCTPAKVAERAAALVGRRGAPGDDLAAAAAALRARALEDLYWEAPAKARPRRLEAARAAWRAVPREGPEGAEAASRLAALGRARPAREGARPACPE